MDVHVVNVCRGCLASDVRLLNIFDAGLAEDYAELVRETNLPLDSLPTTMCSYCVGLLRKATGFRNQCRAAAEYLRLILSNQFLVTEDSLIELHKSIRTMKLGRTQVQVLPYYSSQNPVLKHNSNTKVPSEQHHCTKNDSNIDLTASLKGEIFQNDLTSKDEVSTKIEQVKDEVLVICDDDDDWDRDIEMESIIDFANDFSSKHNVKVTDDESVMILDGDSVDFDLSHDSPVVKEMIKNVKSDDCKSKRKANETKERKKNNNDVSVKLKKVVRARKKSKMERYKEKLWNIKLDFLKNNELDITMVDKEQAKKELEDIRNTEEFKMAKHKCEKCAKTFTLEKSYKQHMAIHDKSRGEFECEICGALFKDSNNAKRHEVTVHLHTFTCKICSKTFKLQRCAVDHTQTHRNFMFTCQQCGKQFKHRSAISEHKRKKHGSARCPICDFICFNESSVQTHIAYTHNLPCELCGARFQTIGALDQHRAEAVDNVCDNGKKPCTVCGEGFNSERAFEDHKSSCKPKESFQCEKCHRRFSSNRSLKDHMSKYKGGCPSSMREFAPRRRRGNISDPTLGKQTNGMRLVCEVCGKDNFHCEAALRIHQRLHTGEKPYQCEICNKTFRLKVSLKTHMAMHTGEKAYECSLCGHRFRQHAHLRQHVIGTHTNEKPYACKYCDKRFPYLTSKREHENAHQGIYRNRTPGDRKKRKDPALVSE